MSVLEGLDIFVAICDAGSIAQAGRVLGVPRATLSRQLARLESSLGVTLLHRTTRRLVPTPAGEELYVRARRIVDEAEVAREAVRRQDNVPRGTLRVSVPPDIDTALRAMFMEYLRRHPQVALEVTATGRHVDLVGEGIDVAIRAGRLRDPSLLARRLAQTTVGVYASPDYLARRGRPEHPEALLEHECIQMLAPQRGQPEPWPLLDGGTVPVRGRLICNSLSLVLDAVRAGHGLALLPAFRLMGLAGFEQVLADSVGTQAELSIVFTERTRMLPRVRAFIDIVVEWAAKVDLINLGLDPSMATT